MPAVVFRPTAVEYGLNSETYDDMVRQLQAGGIAAEVERPVERRSGGIQHAAADVAVYLFENADNITAIVGAVVVALRMLARRGRPRRTRRAVIYGPNGEVLKEVELGPPPD